MGNNFAHSNTDWPKSVGLGTPWLSALATNFAHTEWATVSHTLPATRSMSKKVACSRCVRGSGSRDGHHGYAAALAPTSKTHSTGVLASGSNMDIDTTRCEGVGARWIPRRSKMDTCRTGVSGGGGKLDPRCPEPLPEWTTMWCTSGKNTRKILLTA